MTDEDFIPEVHEEPSEYLNLDEEKEYKVRVLSPIIEGYEGWVETMIEGKKKRIPKRFRTFKESEAVEFSPSKYDNPDQPVKAKAFWAMIVWNYELEVLQVWQPTQKTIQKKLRAFAIHPDWGHLRNYDLTITRINNQPVEYSIVQSPPKPVKEEILETYLRINPDLSLLFSGGHPISKRNPSNFTEEKSKVPF